MRIQIKKEIRGYHKELELLRRLAPILLRKLTNSRAPGAAALKKVELSLLLTSDKKIQKINREWRKKDKATDVLSFPQCEVPELRALSQKAKSASLSEWCIGDIIISLERAEEQAKEKGIRFHQELKILLVHGLLHLLGYDHETNIVDARRMQRMERKLLTR